MSTSARRSVAPKLGNSFLTRQLSLQSPTPPVQQPTQHQGQQQQTQQHRKLAFRRQSSEDLSLRRGRRRGRDTPSPAPPSDRGKSKNASGPEKAGDQKKTNASSDRSSDVRWCKQGAGPATEVPPPPITPSLFNRHFPESREASAGAGFPVGVGGPIGGRPITPARPKPVRLAWAEKRSATLQSAALPADPGTSDDPAEEDAPVEVVAKKMGQPKPVSGSVLKAQLSRNQHNISSMSEEKDSVLQTRQQLADKLRRAWWGEDQLRPNLDIFLTCLANESNGGECTPPGEESAKEGARMNALKDNMKGGTEASAEQREGKTISIKIDTIAKSSENSSKEGENEDGTSQFEQKPSSIDSEGSIPWDVNGKLKSTVQVFHQSPSSSKASPYSPAFPLPPSGGLTGEPFDGALTSSSKEGKSLSVTSHAGHAAGNESVCGAEICGRLKQSFPPRQEAGGDGGAGQPAPAETAPPVRVPITPNPAVTALQTSAASSFPASFTDASPMGFGQVTNGVGGAASQANKGPSEMKKEATSSASSKPQTASGNENKASGPIGSANLRRAQFRNSSMNRRTVARSADANPTAGGQERTPTNRESPATSSATAGQATPGTLPVTSRTNGTPTAANGNVVDAGGRGKEDLFRTRRGVQQTPDGSSTTERYPWKRNAESAGITRSCTIDVGESSQPAEFGATSSSSSSSPYSSFSSAGLVQPRPSTALRSSDRSVPRPATSFVTAAAAKHRQKAASSKRKTVRRSSEDDEGAEGECGEEPAARGAGGHPRGKGGVRGVHADVVTMVSLVSPTGSDTEEPLPQVFSFPRDPTATPPAVPTPVAVSSRAHSTRRGGMLSRMMSMDAEPERSTQRKLHKSVSFQSDLLPDEDEGHSEDAFSRRPAFPASLIIPRVPLVSPFDYSTADSSSSTASSTPDSSFTAAATAASAPPLHAPAPVIIPPSLSQHVPKIVDPSTPRNSYSPPGHPASPGVAPQHKAGQTTGQRPSTAVAATVAGVSSGTTPPGNAGGADSAASSTEKGRLSRKRVMFRSRSASLRGSEDDRGELKEKTGGAQSSNAGVVPNTGNPSGGGVRVDGGAGDKSQTSASNAAANKQRGVVVILSERQDHASSKAEDKSKGARVNGGGGNMGGPRPSTAGAIGRGPGTADKGRKEQEEASDAKDETEDEGVRTPEFKSAKEKECWELYRKMCDKGLTVSYDTILRGMLTPTEYRMRRNALLSTC